jgi:ATP-dependent helicase/DNAse subunit B
LWAATRLEVIDDCLQWLEQERDDPLTRALPNVACEARFGRRRPGEQQGTLSRDEPIELEVDGHRLRLTGRIDRINWSDDRGRFRVIDYKTGRIRSEHSGELQGGRMLQLPLYVLAGATLLDADPRGGEAAYVYPTRRGEFRTVEWSGEDLGAREGEVQTLLGAILDGIARGDFMVAPWDADKACRYCRFDPVCPRGRSAYVKRKAADERLTGFATTVRSVP